jgi:putative phage-type endonuclease
LNSLPIGGRKKVKIKAKKLKNTKNLSELEWLKVRQQGIGGSDASAIAGLNKWKSPLNVYIDKVEPIEDVGETSEAAEWGHELEPVIRNKFRKKHPELRVQQSFYTWQSIEHPFMIANVDGLIFHPEKGWGILEIKTSSEWRKGEWSEETIPEEYLIQACHYMSVLGLNYCYFAVLIGGNKYREFYVERDEVLIESLITLEKDFWYNHVLALNPPEPDGSKGSGELLDILYPVEFTKDKKEIKELPKEAIALVDEYEAFSEQEKAMKEEKEAIKNKLKSMLGDYQIGVVLDSGRKVKWTESTWTQLDQKGLKRDYPEIFEKYSKVCKSRRFSIN